MNLLCCPLSLAAELERKLKCRADRDDLVKKNILPGEGVTGVSPSVLCILLYAHTGVASVKTGMPIFEISGSRHHWSV